jgi:sugar lactone lactonase YvrE
MAATLFATLRRIAGFASLPLLLALCYAGEAAGQSTAPLVVASAPSGMDHPTGWGWIWDTAIDAQGDWLVVDYSNGALYEFPAGGGQVLTLATPKTMGSYQNPGIAIDLNNNLYIGGNWNNCLLQFPYDPATKTWPGLATLNNSTNLSSGCAAPYNFAQYGLFPSNWNGDNWGFQPWGLAVDKNNTLWIANQVAGNWTFTMGINGTSPGTRIQTIYKMTTRANSVAVDPWLNSYYVEDASSSTGEFNGKTMRGVLELTAAQYQSAVSSPPATGGAASDAELTNVAPAAMTSSAGIASDPAGNLYASDSIAGVFLIPNPSGTPDTAGAFPLTSMPGTGAVAVDAARHIMYVPTSAKQSNDQADVAMVNFAYAELGASPVGKATSTAMPVAFTFNGSVTPASFVIIQAGKTKSDFTLADGTCTAGTAYAANSSCTESVSFTPSVVGSVSAKLLMLDANNNALSSITLHGTGMGATAQLSPGVESTVGSGLKTPSQVTVDAAGNLYVADPGQGAVLMYPAGSSTSTSIGTGLSSPTGVAVDGAGDVFIADNGNVYEIPYGPSGLNMSAQATLVSGLGSNLNLAADSLGNLYIADPDNNRVVKVSFVGGTGPGVLSQSTVNLTSGFTAPTAVAVDSNNNLYVVDGANLLEVAGGIGAPATLLNNLSGATGLAVDPSGAVYITSGSATERIPFVSGALASGSATTIAADVSGATSVALDSKGNVYVAPSAGGAITLVNTNGTLTLPTPADLTSSTDAVFTVTNTGNSPLSITKYTSSNAVDFTAADTTSGGCIAGSPVAVGGSCTVDVTFNPGAGEQGALTSQIALVSNAFNTPVMVTANGVGLTLANSTTAGTPGTAPEVVNTPVSVTVTPKSGTGAAPTGTVTITYESWTVTGSVPTVKPISASVTASLVDGKASFTLAPVLAGAQSIVVNYSGDRVYGRSTTTMAVNIAKSQITGLTTTDPNAPSYLPFVLESGSVSGSIPYDGSQSYWQYSMPVKVNTAAGIPTGTLTFMDDSSTCPPGTSATGQGAAICALVNYKGQACPTAGNAAVVNIANDGTTPTGAAASPAFATGCLQMPQNTTYTPVVSTHWITPVYSGDVNFMGFTGTQGTLFQALRSPEVLITSSPSSLTVQKGSSVSANLTITSLLGYGYAGKGGQLNDYNFPISLACSNLPPHSVCTFSYPATVSPAQPSAPNSVQIPCTGTTAAAANCAQGQVQITVNTNVTVGTTTSSNATVASVTLASLFGFGMIGLFIRRKSFAKRRLLLMGFMVVVGCSLAICVTACNTTNLSPNAALSTPPGTYAVTVTAQQVGYQCVPLAGPGANCTTTSGGPGVSVFGSQNQVSVPFYIPVTVQ